VAVRTISASNAAYDKLRTDIVRSVLVSGERFSEDSLVSRYGFGKAAVRAALLRLHHDGLVERAPRRAHQVTLLTEKDAAEINAMRVVLEPEAARLAAERRTDGQARRIEQLAHESSGENVDRQPARFLSANQAFHRAIAEASGNQRLASAIDNLMAEGERDLYSLLRLRPVASFFGRNNLLVAAAVTHKEPDRASELMRALVLDGKQFFSNAFEFVPRERASASRDGNALT
jgi:DNA-binding GntR family transcriptional regulator